MTRCPQPHCGGRLLADDGRVTCSLCSRVVRDTEPGTLEKLLSNVTPESSEVATRRRGRPVVGPDIAAIAARVMDRIRQETARG